MTMSDDASFAAALAEHGKLLAEMPRLQTVIDKAARRLAGVIRAGGKILWCGNGGSAADSQHLAAELVVRFEADRPGLASIALTTDVSILTASANDLGFAATFARQVEALGRPGDALVAISTSGNSPNVLAAVAAAKVRKLTTIALTGGSGGELASRCDLSVVVPSQKTARIQEMHILIGHSWCSFIEKDAMRAGAGHV
jgi:D-sedoheptulose 7-phosphate isomerase